jgi:hypothetical protein
MSEAVRAVALAEANKLKGDTGDAAEVVKAANVFLTFLSGGAGAPAKTSAAGAEPAPKAEAKPTANTAGAKPAKAAKPAKKTEEQLAAEALEKANAEAAAEGEDEPSGPTEAIPATKEGVSLAVKTLIEGGKRDDAIALLKKYKAASVSAMQAKDEATIGKFIADVNGVLGLEASEPDLEG